MSNDSMPSIDHNKIWAEELKRFENNKGHYSYYGEQWGDPNMPSLHYWIRRLLRQSPQLVKRIVRRLVGKRFFDFIPGDLSYVTKHYVRPYVNQNSVVLEIGPGGGRWTKCFLHARQLILVELNPDFFSYLEKRFPESVAKFRYYETKGDELDGIETASVDYAFTFGTFVHLDPEIIQSYLHHIERVLCPGGIAVLQYPDKTKQDAKGDGFANMTASRMEEFVSQIPSFKPLAHNLRLLSHSNIIILQKVD